ncbi:MAG: CHASE domain-containing protein [Rheinheimera sp.]|nr:CHASE domain-containing protein [Rheinheimera sp.]
MSSWASYWLYHEFQSENTAEFNRLTDQISSEVEQRFRLPIYGLNGARGVYAASEQVTRDDFRRYVASRNMKVEFPGVRGFGFIERVPYANLSKFLSETRADGAPDFQVRQLSNRGDAELLVIKFIEPLLKNLQAVGLDVASEQQRRTAARTSHIVR